MFDNSNIETILKSKYQYKPCAKVQFGEMNLVAGMQWLFSTNDFEEGWISSPNTTTDMVSKDGRLECYFNANTLSWIKSPAQLEIDASTYNHILIRIQFEAHVYSSHAFRLYYVDNETDAINDNFVHYKEMDTTGQDNDDQWYEYDIDLSAESNWNGNIYQLKLLFDDRADKNIYIDYIRVQSDSSTISTGTEELLQAEGSMPSICRDTSGDVWAAWIKTVTGGVVPDTKTWTTTAELDSGSKSQVVIASDKVELNTSGYPASLLLWTQLESAADVTNPQVGTGGTDNADNYTGCKFNNGANMVNTGKYIYFPSASDLNKSEGCIEFWFKPSFNSNAVPHQCRLIDNYKVSSSDGIVVYLSNNQWNIYLYSNVNKWTLPASSFSSGDLIHIAISWDKTSSIDGTKCLVCYIDNIEAGSATGVFNDPDWETNTYFGNTPLAPTYVAEGVIDNIKTWNYAKTDFSDKDTEAPSAAYYNNGYTELIYDAGAEVDWTTYDFSTDLLEPANTNVKLKFDTSDDNIVWAGWSGWFDGSSGNMTGVPSSRYLKVHGYLETTDTDFTPTLGEIEINGNKDTTVYNIKYKKHTGSWGAETLVEDAGEYANNLCLYENNTPKVELVRALDDSVKRIIEDDFNSGSASSVVTHASGDMRCWAFAGADGNDYIYYSYVDGSTYYVRFKSSSDNYVAETSVTSSTSKIKNISVIEDDKNIIWLVYEQYNTSSLRPTFIHLYCMKSNDYGVTWGSATKISSTETIEDDLWLSGTDKTKALCPDSKWEDVFDYTTPISYKGTMYNGKIYMVDSFLSRLDGVTASDFNKLYKFDGADLTEDHDFSGDSPAEKAYDIISAQGLLWIQGTDYVQTYDETTLTKQNTTVIDCANESYTFGEINICNGGLPIYACGGKVGGNDGKYNKFIDYVGWEGLVGLQDSDYILMESYYFDEELYVVAYKTSGNKFRLYVLKFNNSTIAFPFNTILDDYTTNGYEYGGTSNYFITSKVEFLNGLPYLLISGGDSAGATIESRIYNLYNYTVSKSLSGTSLDNFIRTTYSWKGEKYYISKETTWKKYKYDEVTTTWDYEEIAPCQAVDSIKTKIPKHYGYPRVIQTDTGQILVYYSHNKKYYREPGKVKGILIERDSSLNVGETYNVSLINRYIHLGFDVGDWDATQKVSIYSRYHSGDDEYQIFYQVLTKVVLNEGWTTDKTITREIKGMSLDFTEENEANTFDVEFSNADNKFSPDNTQSELYTYLAENKEMRLYLGFNNHFQLLMTGMIDGIVPGFTPEGEKTTKITGKDFTKKIIDNPITLVAGEDKDTTEDVNILIASYSGNTLTDSIPSETLGQGERTAPPTMWKIPVEFEIPQTYLNSQFEFKLENVSPNSTSSEVKSWFISHDGAEDKLRINYFINVKIITVSFWEWNVNFDIKGTSRTDSSTKVFGSFNINYDDQNVTEIESGYTVGVNCVWNDSMPYKIYDILIEIPSKEVADDYDLTLENTSYGGISGGGLDFAGIKPYYITKDMVHGVKIKMDVGVITPDGTDFDYNFDLRYTSTVSDETTTRVTKEELFYILCQDSKIGEAEFKEPLSSELPKVSFIEDNALDCFEKLRQVCYDKNNKLYTLGFNNNGKLILEPKVEDYIKSSKTWTTDADFEGGTLSNALVYDNSIYLAFSGGAISGVYDGNVLPAIDGWSESGAGGTKSVSGGLFHWVKTNSGYYYIAYKNPSFSNVDGWVIECALTITTSPYDVALTPQVYLSSFAGTTNWTLYFAEDRIILCNDYSDAYGTIYDTYMMSTTSRNVYKLVTQNDVCTVYVNNTAVMTCSLSTPGIKPSGSVSWGDHMQSPSQTDCEFYLDYIKYNTGTQITYVTNGYDRLQFNATKKVNWESYTYSGSEATNTNIKVRCKTAETQAGLASATWSKWYEDTSDTFDSDVSNSQWIEVEAYLETTDITSTPILYDLTINYRELTVQRNLVWNFTEYQDIIKLDKPRKDVDMITQVKVTGMEDEVKEVVYAEKEFYETTISVDRYDTVSEATYEFTGQNGSLRVDPASIRVEQTGGYNVDFKVADLSETSVKIYVYNNDHLTSNAWVTLKIYAKPIGEVVPTAIFKIETDISAKRQYGLKTEDIDNHLVATEQEAENIAKAVLDTSNEEREPVDFETIAGLLIQTGDFITVRHQDSSTDSTYRVKEVHHDLEVSAEGNKITSELKCVKII